MSVVLSFPAINVTSASVLRLKKSSGWWSSWTILLSYVSVNLQGTDETWEFLWIRGFRSKRASAFPWKKLWLERPRNNTIEHMTLVGAKTFFWPLSKAQKHFFPLLDDALISLFSPFHETFRVFRDATKKCENLSSLPRFPRERKNEFTWLRLFSADSSDHRN